MTVNKPGRSKPIRKDKRGVMLKVGDRVRTTVDASATSMGRDASLMRKGTVLKVIGFDYAEGWVQVDGKVDHGGRYKGPFPGSCLEKVRQRKS